MATYSGTPGNETLTGTTADDIFLGSGGSDTIIGGGTTNFGDNIQYSPSGAYAGIAGPVTVNFSNSLYSGSVTKPTGTDTFSGIRGVTGTVGNDTLIGTTNTSNNYQFYIQLTGGAGNDAIDGKGLTINTASYQFSPNGISVNLQTSIVGSDLFGTAQDGFGSTDTLKNVVRVRGSAFNDTIVGSDASDFFDGSLGNDRYDGVSSQVSTNVIAYDTADFSGNIRSLIVTAGNPIVGLFGGQTASIDKISLNGGINYTDTTSNISQIRGSDASDTFVGSTTTYTFFGYRFRGEGGNDTFYGQNNTANNVDYSDASAAITVDLKAGTATGGGIGNDTLISVVSVRGSNFNDALLGGALSDVFGLGDSGLHTINGREGANRVVFYGSGNVTIDLGTTASTDGFGGYQGSISKTAGTDTILNVANAQGGNGNDALFGTAGDNQLSGGLGTNTIDGRGGYDTLNYQYFTGLRAPTHGATVNLADGVGGTATNPWDGTDTLQNIEAVRGSQFDDDLTGATLVSGVYSTVEGYGGIDTLRAPSFDAYVTATYANSLSGVTVDLGAGATSNDGWFGGHDILVNIQSVLGSSFADVLTGHNDFTTTDRIEGGGGNDTVNGKGGTNYLDGGLGDDTAVFDIRLADSTVNYDSTGHVIVAGPGAYNVLSGFEHYQFADGLVNERAGSVLVDDLFYYAANKDVFAAGVDATAHYNQFGWHDGRNPNAYFSTNGYLAANPDVAVAGANPLTHYDQNGWKEGRDPSAAFDNELYLERNPDVKAAGIDPLAQFLQYGQAEGRQAYAAVGPVASFTHGSFDPEYYLLSNPDVAKAALQAGGNTFEFAYQHYQTYGWHEGRNPNQVFDVKGYLDAYGDVKSAGIDPLAHYDINGWQEGRDPSAHFDTKLYGSNYQDVSQAHIDPLTHYLTNGIHEGRSVFDDGHFG